MQNARPFDSTLYKNIENVSYLVQAGGVPVAEVAPRLLPREVGPEGRPGSEPLPLVVVDVLVDHRGARGEPAVAVVLLLLLLLLRHGEAFGGR